MRIRRQHTYQSYADVYDDFKGDRSSTVQLLLTLIKKYKPNTHSILDLACGTGSIAQGLVESFTVFGLDSSKRMLDIAKHKAPGAHFEIGDMASFKLNVKFDVVYCLHNSVNHLLTFEQWESMFNTVASHLVVGGLFIFDSNPSSRMDYLSTLGPSVKSVGEDYVITQVSKNEATKLYTWDVKILLKKGRSYILKHEPVAVSSYSEHKITRALKTNFDLVDRFELPNPATPDDIGRVYYVCTKRSS